MSGTSIWCAWCGESITMAFVSPGGVVYHIGCWRRRVPLVGRKDG
ncbi:MAG TPA: hypothetical protein VMS64_11520 [Candidatus Methylomirabilis sp.]|nr:hypothetical protein [Candidatus Methylomirabilis sp.]